MASHSDMRCGFPLMAQVLTPGERGRARVEAFTISEADARMANLRAAWQPGGRMELVSPGSYLRLYVNGSLMMSDTDMECRTNRDIVEDGRGHVLIGGLGLGLIVLPLLRKSEVTAVTVIEKSVDVIDLIEPQIRCAVGRDADKLHMEHGNVFQWTPTSTPRRIFDVVYMDIWPDVCTDNLDQIITLHKRYRAWLRPGGRVSSWRHEWLKDLRRMGR